MRARTRTLLLLLPLAAALQRGAPRERPGLTDAGPATEVEVRSASPQATRPAVLAAGFATHQPARWSLSYWEAALSSCRNIFGVPKFAWALLCDALALALVLLCIPLLLTCSRRRPPGAPLFDCSFGQAESGSLKAAPWMQA
mmetsp:Transcript_95197/g.268926  ORF Transcript_95197/g.268926 Transcript_95197/m.268926 type:complete len:142 (+) Transcript_95197:85-510(+)